MNSRILLILFATLYFLSLDYAYFHYLYDRWEYFGFNYHEKTWLEQLFVFSLVIFGSFVVPIKLNRISSFILIYLFMVLYVPIMLMTSYADSQAIELYGVLMISLGIGFTIMCLLVKRRIKPKIEKAKLSISWPLFKNLILSSWAFCIIIFFYYYGAQMNFVSMEGTYDQRALTGSLSVPRFISYVQSIFTTVISPFIMAYGLLSRKWGLFLMGLGGLFVLYAITAAKTAFALPFLYLLVFYALERPFIYRNWALLTLGFSSIINIGIVYYFTKSIFWTYAGVLYLFRMLGLPGLSFTHYYDYFSFKGFTWWSHVKGFSLIIAPPVELQAEPSWPNLGFLVGRHVYDGDINANANFFSGDGAAAGGAIGVLAISIIFGLWLRLLDASTHNWNNKFVILCLLAYSVFLTDAHFFTSLVSFGGIFWFIFFRYVSLGNSWPNILKSKP